MRRTDADFSAAVGSAEASAPAPVPSALPGRETAFCPSPLAATIAQLAPPK